MKHILLASAAVAAMTLAACDSKKEEPQTPPAELPAPAVNADSIARAQADSIAKAQADSLAKAQADSAAAAAKKPGSSKKPAQVQTNADGSASGGQVRPSRDQPKAEGEASGGQIRKSR